jgi:flavin reductase (DIM6/NTAB) family NADH-FMN oxidoreductase RutF
MTEAGISVERSAMQGSDTVPPFKYARGNLCMPVVCITSAFEGKRNIMTSAWCSPSSFYPPIVSSFIGVTRFTHDLVMKSREFVLNILASDQTDLAVYCGNHTGREVDKFEALGVKVAKGRLVAPPLIVGCAAHVECKVLSYHLVGDHTLFVGETVAYDEDPDKQPLIRFRGEFFTVSERSLGSDDHPAKV